MIEPALQRCNVIIALRIAKSISRQQIISPSNTISFHAISSFFTQCIRNNQFEVGRLVFFLHIHQAVIRPFSLLNISSTDIKIGVQFIQIIERISIPRNRINRFSYSLSFIGISTEELVSQIRIITIRFRYYSETCGIHIVLTHYRIKVASGKLVLLIPSSSERTIIIIHLNILDLYIVKLTVDQVNL